MIVTGALLAAESGHHETFAATIGSAAIAAALYWMAHAYANVLGRRIVEGERLTGRLLIRELALDAAILRGAAVPILALLLAWALGAGLEAGVTAAVWSAVATLVVLELLAGIGSHAAPRELALDAAIGALMGMAILTLKILLA